VPIFQAVVPTGATYVFSPRTDRQGTNHGAVSLCKKLGFSIVGTLPKAFLHQQSGYVDAHVIYRFLDDIEV